jgi:rhamnose utilization protein RhaD (predicted bifunctional aldolase and dehydrogenase)
MPYGRNCPYLVHDFKGLSVEEDVSKAQKNIMGLGKKVGFNEVDLDVVEKLLNFHKEELSPEDLVQLKKEHQEEEEGTAKVEVVHTLMSNRLVEPFHPVEVLPVLNEDDLTVNKVQKGQDVFC